VTPEQIKGLAALHQATRRPVADLVREGLDLALEQEEAKAFGPDVQNAPNPTRKDMPMSEITRDDALALLQKLARQPELAPAILSLGERGGLWGATPEPASAPAPSKPSGPRPVPAPKVAKARPGPAPVEIPREILGPLCGATAKAFGVSPVAIESEARGSQAVQQARAVLAHVLLDGGYSLAAVGRALKRTGSSIRQTAEYLKSALTTDRELAAKVAGLRAELEKNQEAA
jgi:hypothetical protein